MSVVDAVVEVLLAVAATIVVSLLPFGAVRRRRLLAPPVDAPVSDPFREPGVPVVSRQPRHRVRHRHTGTAVTAVATGRVTFAGSVAGTDYVVVRHADGRSSDLRQRRQQSIERDDLVVRGMRIGSPPGRSTSGVRARRSIHRSDAADRGAASDSPRLIPIDGAGRPGPTAPAALRWRAPRIAPPGRDPVPARYNRQPVHRPVGRPSIQPLAPSSGRLGAGSEFATAQGACHGRHQHASNAGSWSPLRTPDPPVEPEDEAFHLR